MLRARSKWMSGRWKDNNYYARGSALEGIYKVPNDLGDGLNKTIDDFRQKKVFDFGWSDPSRIEVKDNGKIRTFAKSGDKWTEGAKTITSACRTWWTNCAT